MTATAKVMEKPGGGGYGSEMWLDVSQAGFPLHGSSGPMFFFFPLKWLRSDRKHEHVSRKNQASFLQGNKSDMRHLPAHLQSKQTGGIFPARRTSWKV